MRACVALVCYIVAVSAFPAVPESVERRQPTSFERAQTVLREKQLEDTFNATEQYITTANDHRFIAPRAGDLRGPCPFLNAAANHGWIDRSGYTTGYEVVAAAVNVFGMGRDLAMFLTSYAAIVYGDMTSFSIGGRPTQAQAAAHAGQHTLGAGLANSHNMFEGDVSPIAADRDERSKPTEARLDHFQQLLSLHPQSPNANYDMPTLADFRALRHNDSLNTNKYHFNGPFSGLVMQPLVYSAMYRLFANHSELDPAGYLSQDTLKSFYAITTDEQGELQWTPGHERIPDNWYRRSRSSPYDNHFFLNDALYQASKHSEFLRIGGNVDGYANRVRPVDVKVMTNGVYRTSTLHQDWNFACLGYQFAVKTAEDTVKQLYYSPSIPMKQLRAAAEPLLESMECPPWSEPVDMSALEWYPGFRKQEKTKNIFGIDRDWEGKR